MYAAMSFLKLLFFVWIDFNFIQISINQAKWLVGLWYFCCF